MKKVELTEEEKKNNIIERAKFLLNNFISGEKIERDEYIYQKIRNRVSFLYFSEDQYILDLETKLKKFIRLASFLNNNNLSMMGISLKDEELGKEINKCYDTYSYYKDIYNEILSVKARASRTVEEFNKEFNDFSKKYIDLKSRFELCLSQVKFDYTYVSSFPSTLKSFEDHYDKFVKKYDRKLFEHFDTAIKDILLGVSEIKNNFKVLEKDTASYAIKYYYNDIIKLYNSHESLSERISNIDTFSEEDNMLSCIATNEEFLSKIKGSYDKLMYFNNITPLSEDQMNEINNIIISKNKSYIGYYDVEIILAMNRVLFYDNKLKIYDVNSGIYKTTLTKFKRAIRQFDSYALKVYGNIAKWRNHKPYKRSKLGNDFYNIYVDAKNKYSDLYNYSSKERKIINFENDFEFEFFDEVKQFLLNRNMSAVNLFESDTTIDIESSQLSDTIRNGLNNFKIFNKWMEENNLTYDNITENIELFDDRVVNSFKNNYPLVKAFFSTLVVKKAVSKESVKAFVGVQQQIISVAKDIVKCEDEKSLLPNNIINGKKKVLTDLYNEFEGDFDSAFNYMKDKIFEINSLFNVDLDFKCRVREFFDHTKAMNRLVLDNPRNVTSMEYREHRKYINDLMKYFSDIDIIAIDKKGYFSSIISEQLMTNVISTSGICSKIPLKKSSNFGDDIRKFCASEKIEVNDELVFVVKLILDYCKNNKVVGTKGTFDAINLSYMSISGNTPKSIYGNSVLIASEIKNILKSISSSYKLQTGNDLYVTSNTINDLVRLYHIAKLSGITNGIVDNVSNNLVRILNEK